MTEQDKAVADAFLAGLKSASPAELPEHVSKKIDYSETDKIRKFWFAIAIVIALTILAGIILVLFRDDAETVQRILIPIITALGGAIGGYGIGKSRTE